MTENIWKKLLCENRFSSDLRPKNSKNPPDWILQTRTQTERDYDRILFSTPLRRLGDKTQVFPLEKIESIRRRLTHSHEVSNLARSIGVHLAEKELKAAGKASQRNIPSVLAAIGLAHDIGNPPFGHKGEAAIQSWFKRNKVFDLEKKPELKKWAQEEQKRREEQGEEEKSAEELISFLEEDFLKFEGNAQALRILTRLQVVTDDLGINLTYGTLAASMKYTVPSYKTNKKNVAAKKHGFFFSEKELVKDIWEKTGLGEGRRHPLTYVMEACDDIAYSVLDAEDAVKKQIVSFHDVIAWLEKKKETDDEVTKYVLEKSKEDYEKLSQSVLSPAEINDVSMQKFRVYAINACISCVITCFIENKNKLLNFSFNSSLLEKSMANNFCELMKEFDLKNGYKHKSVLENELYGYNVICELMDLLWIGITERKDKNDLGSKRENPFANYAYQRISENYRRIFEDEIESYRKNNPNLPIRYKEAQLLTDMISGMTDSFATELLSDLKKYYNVEYHGNSKRRSS